MEFTNFVDSKHQLSDADFDWLEGEIGIRLPQDVRLQYLMFNGGEPEDCIYIHNGYKYVVQEFFSIKYGKTGHTIEDNYRELACNEKVIPKDIVPFASDPAGDFYCIDMATGNVVIFRSEHLPNLNNCITVLAKSMTEFVNGLVEDD